jgi:hypothetical protein
MRNIFLFILCCTLFTVGNAQETPEYKKTEFGILMQANFGYLKVDQSDWNNLGINNEINALETQNRFGFGLGILAKFNITKNLSIVPQPSLYFQDNRLNFDLETLNDHEEEIKPVALALPIHLVFTKRKWKKWNPSVALGARFVYGIDASDTPSPLSVQNHDIAIDFGAGVEIKFNHFKVKPELLVSRGLMNLKEVDDAITLVETSVASIRQDQIALRVSFYN